MATFLKKVNFSDYNGSHFYLELNYDLLSQDVSKNQSKIRYYEYIGSTDGYSAYGSSTPTYINGSQVGSITEIPRNSRTFVGQLDVTVSHKADGTGTANYSASISTNWGGLGSASLNGSITLPTIPRASSIVATDSYVESASTINISRASNSFTHTLSYSFEGLTGTIVSKTTNTSYGWVIPATFYDKLKTTHYTEGKTCTITCQTYNDSTLIGTSTTTMKVSVNPDSDKTKPTVSATITLDSTTNSLTGATNRVIRSVTDVTVKMTASAKNGATISNKTFSCADGKSRTSDGTINNVESASFVVSATDSRGITNSKSYNLVLVEYVTLTINPVFYRTQPTNNTIALTFTGNYFNQKFGTSTSTANILTVKYRYKESTSTTWSSYVTLNKALSGNTYNNGTSPITLGTGFNYTKEYNFEIVATDRIGSKTVSATVTQGIPVFDWGKNDFKFNVPVYQQSGNQLLDYSIIDSSKKAIKLKNEKGDVFPSPFYPVGSIYISANKTNPSTYFGGTWKLIENVFLYGASEKHPAGETGGEEEHTLTMGEMPSHNHKQYFYIANSLPGGIDGFLVYGSPNGSGRNFGNYMSESLGGNKPHNNMPPYRTVYIWERTA